MEESLKARLIGASVLVAVAVLLIPELLSGRKATQPVTEEIPGPRGTRTFTIELGDGSPPVSRGPVSSPTPVPAAAGPLPAPPGTQPPQAASEAAATAATESAPEAAAPAVSAPITTPRAEPAPPPAPTAAAPTGGWAVQVGAFSSVDTARKMVKDLNGAGFSAFLSPVQRDGRTLYRVRVGPEQDRAGAEELVPRIKARGLPATVVQNE